MKSLHESKIIAITCGSLNEPFGRFEKDCNIWCHLVGIEYFCIIECDGIYQSIKTTLIPQIKNIAEKHVSLNNFWETFSQCKKENKVPSCLELFA